MPDGNNPCNLLYYSNLLKFILNQAKIFGGAMLVIMTGFIKYLTTKLTV